MSVSFAARYASNNGSMEKLSTPYGRCIIVKMLQCECLERSRGLTLLEPDDGMDVRMDCCREIHHRFRMLDLETEMMECTSLDWEMAYCPPS